jgi:hypothetical protein
MIWRQNPRVIRSICILSFFDGIGLLPGGCMRIEVAPE